MREIKFRAWDKDGEKMTYSDKHEWDYDFSFDGESGNLACAVNCCYCDTFGDEHDDWKELDNIMQYTGFKDKNGKEIYEGDIVKDGNGEIFKVEWQPFSGAWNLSGTKYYFLFAMRYMNTFEVVGNIYENPELLESGAKE